MNLYDSLIMLDHWHKNGARPDPAFAEALGKVLDFMREAVTQEQLIAFEKQRAAVNGSASD